jgi:hypothetical protein
MESMGFMTRGPEGKKLLKHYRLNLPVDLFERTDATFRSLGINRTLACERLFCWFCEQSDLVQQLVLNQLARDLRPRALAAIVINLIEIWEVSADHLAEAVDTDYGAALVAALHPKTSSRGASRGAPRR